MFPVKVSVVVPTFNRAEAMRRCLASLVRQTLKDFEVLVCDDGSTDKTRDVLEEFKNSLSIRYLPGHHFGGPSVPRNRGIAEAEGEYVAFLDSDDWWHPTKLARCVSHLERGADFVYHSLMIVDRGASYNRPLRCSSAKRNMLERVMCRGYCIPNSSVMVRSSVIRKVNGFSELPNLVSVEDLDCWIRIAAITDRFKSIPTILGCYGRDGSGISVVLDRQIERLILVYQRNCHLLPGSSKLRADAMLDYRKARVYQMSDQTELARQHFLRATRGRLWTAYRLKSLCALILLKLQECKRSW